jgi:choloylglycine hydrolase
MNSVSGDSESESISQFFHILGSVAQQRGCVHMGDGKYEITIYTSCCNTDKGIYYYTTYENSQITGVDMHREDLEGCIPVSYPLRTGQQVLMEN